jgi:hypothetical protein
MRRLALSLPRRPGSGLLRGALCVAGLSALACSGLPDGVPNPFADGAEGVADAEGEAGGEGEPPPPPAAPDPARVAEAQAAIEAETVLAGILADRVPDVASLVVRLQDVATRDQLEAAYADSARAQKAREEALQEWWATQMEAATEPPFEAWQKVTPGWQIEIYAEGTAALFEHAVGPWSAAAARTPEPDDDLAIAALGQAYGNLDRSGWPTWLDRNWDYGGCSLLGSGAHLSQLKAIDAARAAGPAFRDGLDAVRGEVLDDILQGNGEFPYCQSEGAPTPPSKLRAEVEQILAEVQLEDVEVAALKARMEAGFTGKAPSADGGGGKPGAPEAKASGGGSSGASKAKAKSGGGGKAKGKGGKAKGGKGKGTKGG